MGVGIARHTEYISPLLAVADFIFPGSFSKTLYDNLILDKDKRLISATYSEHSTAAFKTYLSAIREVRNACAHGNVMFGLRLSFGISTGIACPSLKPGTNQSLNGALRVINHMIRQISVNRANDMWDELYKATARLYSKVTYLRTMIEKETGIIVPASI